MKHFILGAIVLTGIAYLTYKNEANTNDRTPAIETEIVEVDTRPQDVETLAKANGFKPSQRIIDAIVRASEVYEIDALELTAIAIIETGIGSNVKERVNTNGTKDKGVFQINTVNYPKCVEYNLDSPEGSALCAAKLLSMIKSKRADYLGVYHSKTPAYKIPRNASKDLKAAMTAFFNGQVLKAGNYVSTENALVYRSISVVDNFKQDVLCLRLIQDGQAYYLGNSSTLQVCGTIVAFGQRSRSWRNNAAEPQRVMEAMGVPMLPFNAFTQAGLKVTQTKIIDQGGAETVKRKTKEDRKGNAIYENLHFTGASLFQNGDSYFLFDIDRVEIAHGIFNPFIVQLPRAVSSIEEAYDSLIPLAVRTAKAEGKTVLRQGEHFFILVAKPEAYKADLIPKSDRNNLDWNDGFVEGRMSAQGNRDHVASRFNAKSGLVSGFIRHQGREHLDLDLTIGWWKPIPNTAVKAFTITGDID